MKDGTSISGSIFISNIDPKATLKMVGVDKFRKSYFNRIESLEGVISAFSLYIVFKPKPLNIEIIIITIIKVVMKFGQHTNMTNNLGQKHLWLQ